MNDRIYVWTKFTIPEWDGWLLSDEIIDKIKKHIEQNYHVSVSWFRTNDWLHVDFSGAVDNATRLTLQEDLTRLITNNMKPTRVSKLLLRWEGSYTQVGIAFTLNEHIQ